MAVVEKLETKSRWAILISGRGSNLRSILTMKDEIDIVCVVSSSGSAFGLNWAKWAKVPTLILEPKIDFNVLTEELKKRGVEKIFLAGFMKILPKSFVEDWPESILNVHPSLLPAYPGLKSIERAFQDQADIGVTVHVVTPEVDAGEILLQKKVVDSSDIQSHSQAWIELKVHICEQQIVREAIRLWSRKKMS
jgi:phosphoribosylglycinamide formyltransferase-1